MASMKPTGAAVRVFRDPSPAVPLKVRKRERPDAGPRPGYDPKVKFAYRDVEEGRGSRGFLTETIDKKVLLGSASLDGEPTRGCWIAGDVLGGIALLLVMNVGAAVFVDWMSSLLRLGWDVGKWISVSVPMALYGCHLFGFASSRISPREHSLGIWAIGLFWGGLLGSVLLGGVAGLIRSWF